jgi:hypothetical protein
MVSEENAQHGALAVVRKPFKELHPIRHPKRAVKAFSGLPQAVRKMHDLLPYRLCGLLCV